MNIEPNFDGMSQVKSATFFHTGLSKADNGKPVTLSANKTVSLTSDGDEIFGVIDSVENDAVSVKLDGFFTLKYTGSDPALGYEKLSADGNGGVKQNANGTVCRVVNVDTLAGEVTFLL